MTPAPTATPVPGFEDWQVINPQGVRISVDSAGLVLDLIGSLLWFNEDRGVLFYRDVTGDFRATATVRTWKASDPAAAPGQDGTIELAGLMARTEIPAENYVFIVSGSIGMSTGLETKTTTSSRSIYVQRGLPTGGDAELRLCRVGPTFELAWRHVDSDEAWTLMSTFERRDMPQTLQVGRGKRPTNPGDLVHPSGVDHLGDACLDPMIELGERHVEPNDGGRPRRRSGLARRARRTAGDGVDLQRTDHPPRIPLGSLCGSRVDAAQVSVERLGAFEFESLLQRRPQLGVRRCVAQVPAVEQRP